MLLTCAISATLIPTPLIEVRYFMTPYIFYRMQVQGQAHKLELLYTLVIACVHLWMFSSFPINGGVDRLMW